MCIWGWRGAKDSVILCFQTVTTRLNGRVYHLLRLLLPGSQSLEQNGVSGYSRPQRGLYSLPEGRGNSPHATGYRPSPRSSGYSTVVNGRCTAEYLRRIFMNHALRVLPGGYTPAQPGWKRIRVFIPEGGVPIWTRQARATIPEATAEGPDQRTKTRADDPDGMVDMVETGQSDQRAKTRADDPNGMVDKAKTRADDLNGMVDMVETGHSDQRAKTRADDPNGMVDMVESGQSEVDSLMSLSETESGGASKSRIDGPEGLKDVPETVQSVVKSQVSMTEADPDASRETKQVAQDKTGISVKEILPNQDSTGVQVTDTPDQTSQRDETDAASTSVIDEQNQVVDLSKLKVVSVKVKGIPKQMAEQAGTSGEPRGHLEGPETRAKAAKARQRPDLSKPVHAPADQGDGRRSSSTPNPGRPTVPDPGRTRRAGRKHRNWRGRRWPTLREAMVY